MVQTVHLNTKQVAERLGVSLDSIYRWKRDGAFPAAVRLRPGDTRWRLVDVEAWETSRTSCFATSFGGL
ncbi:helix-turn-helix domain-containing protein [Loktanella sp. SALINAS62]|uniref:helix-turn-helix transcriptional regulator n=1 Tax=Loktanella sp. SALINAS62 TaxID=2706124 RepID=UPI001B8B5E93|nr:helix-turn-helix domain-containing protein [Loktanella sp. SALINAS62]